MMFSIILVLSTVLYLLSTVCPISSDPFYKISYYIKWVTTSWTHSMSFLAFVVSKTVAINISVIGLFSFMLRKGIKNEIK